MNGAMTTVPATMVTMIVLASAGLLPATALAGTRLITVPLVPLAGAVLAAAAATCFVAVGGSFIGWFGGLAGVGALVVVAAWTLRPGLRPWRDRSDRRLSGRVPRLAGIVGALAVLGACVWCLRGLATPTVGFDARAVWLTRGGWLLQSHHQLLVDLRVPDVVLVQTVYPPLVSASTAVAWGVTGDRSMRLGVVVIAVLNACALAAAAFALVEAGRHVALRLAGNDVARDPGTTGATRLERAPVGLVPVTPMVVGVVAAVSLVFVAAGIAGPFMTNGYADPIWSLAAVGALAFGLQAPITRANQGVALVLVLVAGMSKDEGVATAAALIVLIAVRRLATMAAPDRRRLGWRPLLMAVAELAAVASWPVVMRIIHARGVVTPTSPVADWPGRARVTYDAMAPYVHVLVLAAPLAVVAGLVLSTVRRRAGVANDWWAWTGLALGLLAIGGAFVTGTPTIAIWLVGTAHRVTEFPALVGWWIVATWAVVGSGAAAVPGPRGGVESSGAHPDVEPAAHRVGPSVPVGAE